LSQDTRAEHLLSRRAVTVVAYAVVLFGLLAFFAPIDRATYRLPDGTRPSFMVEMASCVAFLLGLALWVLADTSPALRQRLFVPRARPKQSSPSPLFALAWIGVYFLLVTLFQILAMRLTRNASFGVRTTYRFGGLGVAGVTMLLLLSAGLKRSGVRFDELFSIKLSLEDFRIVPMAFLLELPLGFFGLYLNHILILLSGRELLLQPSAEALYYADGPAWLVGVAVVVGIVPVAEEVLFRGLVYRTLAQRYRLPIAVGFSAVFFAFAHMQSAYFLPLTVIGAALALVYERTGRLTASIFLHGAINLWTVLMIGLA